MVVLLSVFWLVVVSFVNWNGIFCVVLVVLFVVIRCDEFDWLVSWVCVDYVFVCVGSLVLVLKLSELLMMFLV